MHIYVYLYGLVYCPTPTRTEQKYPFIPRQRPFLFSNTMDLCSPCPPDLSPTGKAQPLSLSYSGSCQPESCTTEFALRHLPSTQHVSSHRRGEQGAAPVIHHTRRFQCLHSDLRSYPEQQVQLNCCATITLCSTLTEIVLLTVNAPLKQQLPKYFMRALSERTLEAVKPLENSTYYFSNSIMTILLHSKISQETKSNGHFGMPPIQERLYVPEITSGTHRKDSNPHNTQVPNTVTSNKSTLQTHHSRHIQLPDLPPRFQFPGHTQLCNSMELNFPDLNPSHSPHFSQSSLSQSKRRQ